MVQAFEQWLGVTELSAALYMTSARYFYKAHEMELFHHDYTHTSGLLGLVKGTSCILAVDLSAGQNFLVVDLETPREVDYLIKIIYREDQQTCENQLEYFSKAT